MARTWCFYPSGDRTSARTFRTSWIAALISAAPNVGTRIVSRVAESSGVGGRLRVVQLPAQPNQRRLVEVRSETQHIQSAVARAAEARRYLQSTEYADVTRDAQVYVVSRELVIRADAEVANRIGAFRTDPREPDALLEASRTEYHRLNDEDVQSACRAAGYDHAPNKLPFAAILMVWDLPTYSAIIGQDNATEAEALAYVYVPGNVLYLKRVMLTGAILHRPMYGSRSTFDLAHGSAHLLADLVSEIPPVAATKTPSETRQECYRVTGSARNAPPDYRIIDLRAARSAMDRCVARTPRQVPHAELTHGFFRRASTHVRIAKVTAENRDGLLRRRYAITAWNAIPAPQEDAIERKGRTLELPTDGEVALLWYEVPETRVRPDLPAMPQIRVLHSHPQ